MGGKEEYNTKVIEEIPIKHLEDSLMERIVPHERANRRRREDHYDEKNRGT